MSFTDHVFKIYSQLPEHGNYQTYDNLVKIFVSISGESIERCKLYVNHAMLQGFFGDLSGASAFKSGSQNGTLQEAENLFSNIDQDYFS